MTLFQNWKRTGRTNPEALMVAPFDWLRAMLGDTDPTAALTGDRWMPRADVAETERDFLFTIELPGFDIQDVDVRHTDNQLIVSGERKLRAEERERHYLRVETQRGAFERRFEMPPSAAPATSAIDAMFRNGLLEIRVQKQQSKPAVKVPIRSL